MARVCAGHMFTKVFSPYRDTGETKITFLCRTGFKCIPNQKPFLFFCNIFVLFRLPKAGEKKIWFNSVEGDSDRKTEKGRREGELTASRILQKKQLDV